MTFGRWTRCGPRGACPSRSAGSPTESSPAYRSADEKPAQVPLPAALARRAALAAGAAVDVVGQARRRDAAPARHADEGTQPAHPADDAPAAGRRLRGADLD